MVKRIFIFWCMVFPGFAAGLSLPTAPPIRFVLLGDTGTGEAGQLAVAKAVEEICAKRGCQFALDAGDNIYEWGVESELDSQFQAKFEKPYANLNFPFFMALGNHDQSGTIPGSGTVPEKGDLEVRYTQHSNRWVLPARYYSFTAPFQSATDYVTRNPKSLLEVFVIDTNPLAPQNKPKYGWYRPYQEYDQKQRAWLRDGILASQAPWKLVLGHHPFKNNGVHGSAGEFFGIGLSKGAALKELYEKEICGKVDFLLTGHDHSLQWLKPVESCGARPEMIISGAGAKTNSICGAKPNCHPSEAFWQAFNTLGFFWAEATDTDFKWASYTVDSHGRPSLAFERSVKRAR